VRRTARSYSGYTPFRAFQIRQDTRARRRNEKGKKGGERRVETTTGFNRARTTHRRPYLTTKVYRVNDLACVCIRAREKCTPRITRGIRGKRASSISADRSEAKSAETGQRVTLPRRRDFRRMSARARARFDSREILPISSHNSDPIRPNHPASQMSLSRNRERQRDRDR